MNKCSGCGALLQSKDREQLGYIPEEKKGNSTLCERCFRILHYNDLKQIDLDSTKDVIATVNKNGKMAFFLVDLLNIQTDVMNTYHSIQIPKCLIISKADIIPKSISFERVKSWLKEVYKIEEEVLFLSALKNFNVKSIFCILEKTRCREGYVLGYTNSGKSTLLNQLMGNHNITTSIVPNTTVDFIKIEMDSYTLIDTPGFQYDEILGPKEDISFLRKTYSKSYLKPITYQLKKGASLVIEDIIRLENESEVCNLTLYMSNKLSIKRMYAKNNHLKEKEKMSYTFKRNEDLVMKGLGFITFKTDAKINLYVGKKSVVEVRKSFFER